MTQIGLMLEGQNGLNWEHWARILTTAENTGYQCVFRSDHFTNPNPPDQDSLELWTSLTFAATHTERIEFGPLVTPITFRHPSMTARYAAAVTDLSNGRLVLGMGAGWQEREHHNFGIPFYDFSTRFAMLQDGVEVVTSLLYNDEPTTYEGEHFTLHDAILLPRPAQRTPFLIGGNGPKKTLPLAAKYADEWNAVFLPLATFRERNAMLSDYLEEAGRDPASVKRSMMTQVVYGQDDAELQRKLDEKGKSAAELRAQGLIVGTGNAVIEQISALADVGLERIMLQWLALDDIAGIEHLAADILPHFHE
ncbi:MAG: TIGR03560 family F420-dependent LLM class oxidoreductase [Anaerolineales bacterium]